ncbi:MAG: hypothetical protein VR67_02980 [Peptococcaceae bacterium BRH_c8a]|nr:MAG: hypothetical protein VR67_02980 [Peptococcaceae bacterium BRH_c8a]
MVKPPYHILKLLFADSAHLKRLLPVPTQFKKFLFFKHRFWGFKQIIFRLVFLVQVIIWLNKKH